MPTPFTPWTALAGGALIGLAAAWLLASLGRIAGISGILGNTLAEREERGWRIAFLVSLVVAAGLWFLATGAPGRSGYPLPLLVAGGLLVGFGTRIGNGCTSGHGICGLARLSKRSAAAVAVFMGAGFATVYAMRHLMGVAT